MKHRRASLLLALVLVFSCLSPALAAEDGATGFSDVDSDAWYAPYVEACVQTGVIEGTGDGLFRPDQVLDTREGTAMLMRLHHVLHGGNGALPQPPEDWVPVWVENTDGQALFTAEDYSGWHSAPGKFFLRFRTSRAEELNQTTGTVRLGGLQFAGEFFLWEDDPGQVTLDLSHCARASQDLAMDAFDPCAFREEDKLPQWVQSAWYYAQCNGLDEVARLGGDHSAMSFAEDLYQICGDLPTRFSAEYVPHFDREECPEIYSLREAGVWNGANETGAHYQQGSGFFSRADAAILIGRVLNEELRLETDPDALPHDGYTLTYLADGAEPDSTYPILPLEDGLLTLDGQVVPCPQDDEAWSTRPKRSARRDEYLMLAFSGKRGCGGHAGCTSPELFVWVDAAGQPVTPFSYDQIEPPQSPAFDRPYTASVWGIYYRGDQPVSQKFDWCGDLDRDLRGFVGLDGKIYRIEFEL